MINIVAAVACFVAGCLHNEVGSASWAVFMYLLTGLNLVLGVVDLMQ